MNAYIRLSYHGQTTEFVEGCSVCQERNLCSIAYIVKIPVPRRHRAEHGTGLPSCEGGCGHMAKDESCKAGKEMCL